MVDFRDVLLGEHTIGVDPDCFFRDACAPKSIKIEVKETITHEKYQSPHGGYDIALIRLKKPVPLYHENGMKSLIEPVCLPWSRKDSTRIIENSSNCLVTGWGRTYNASIEAENEAVSSTSLRVAKVPIVRNCFEIWNEKLIFGLGGDKSSYICAGDKTGNQPTIYEHYYLKYLLQYLYIKLKNDLRLQ